MSRIAWCHTTDDPNDPHPVDPHHTATGKWVCFKCRDVLTDGGKSINMAALRTPTTPADPERPGLHTEGA